MNYSKEYEYPLYRRTSNEDPRLPTKGQPSHVPQNFYVPIPKMIADHRPEYETRLPGPGHPPECSHPMPQAVVGATAPYFWSKDLHGWDKNCSCGILTSEYRNPIEYQPVVAANLNTKFNQFTPHGSHVNVGSSSSAIVPSAHSHNTPNDFPLWLKIYSQASVECDHKLHWHMFNVRDLCYFDNVLVKLYEIDLEEIILWYKCYKNALLREMDKRLLKANQQRQMIFLYDS